MAGFCCILRTSLVGRRVLASALALGLALATACSDEGPGETQEGAGGDGAASGEGGASGGTASGGGGAAGTGGSPEGPIAGAVRRYDYSFDLATGAAHAVLTVEVDAPGGSCFQTSCGLPATAVLWNGEPAVLPEEQPGTLSACGTGVPAGGTLALSADVVVPEKTFLGLDVGFSHGKDLAGGTFSYLLSWVGGCDRFGPCDDDPSRLVELGIQVKHPAGTVVLCPGALTAGETLTTCEVSGTLAPTYSAFALAADPLWEKKALASAAGVDVVLYEVPGGEIGDALDVPRLEAFLAWITGLLGPFPYGSELRLAGAPTAWLGFEHPANIVLDEKLPALGAPYADATAHVVMHEIVHQWAGDRTTLASTADFVWKEATAEYLAYVFEDEHGAPGEGDASLAYWDAVALQADHHPRPTDEPTPPVEQFYGDVYGPGPMVLFVQLESLLGREAVLGAIAAFLKEPGARSVEDLRAALEAASSADLGSYFDAWVFGSGEPEWPTFDVQATQVGGEVTVKVVQENASGTLYGCLLEVDVKGATQTETVLIDYGVSPASAEVIASVKLGEPLDGVTVDPRHRVVGHVAAEKDAAPRPKLPVFIF